MYWVDLVCSDRMVFCEGRCEMCSASMVEIWYITRA